MIACLVATHSPNHDCTLCRGRPLLVSDLSGEKHVVPLIRKQTKLNKNLMYNVFEIPDQPLVPLSKRGAITFIRVFSSEADIAAGKPRPRYLRSISLNDPDFTRLYGLRLQITPRQ